MNGGNGDPVSRGLMIPCPCSPTGDRNGMSYLVGKTQHRILQKPIPFPGERTHFPVSPAVAGLGHWNPSDGPGAVWG